MSGRHPDFDELVGRDFDPAERDRLRHVHDALLAAGPPPELATRAGPPSMFAARRRRPALLVLAAAFAIVAFALGLGVSTMGGEDPVRVVALQGIGPEADASASLAVFDADGAGNWPMELEVTGLEPSENGTPFELWLTRDGSPYALCGSFFTNADGTASVRMNAPYSLSDDVGWFVVEKGSEAWLLDTGG